MTKIIPVILSGGSGVRLWPMSREHYPKQFLPLCSNRSTLQETVLRNGEASMSAPVVVCSNEHRFLIAEQLREVGVTPKMIILEPVGRNTAPAAAVAAMVALAEDPDALLLVQPADHIMQNPTVMKDALESAKTAVEQGYLVTFGIQPERPETGYGYIFKGAPLNDGDECFAVERFVEKPDRDRAQSYLDDGRYLWNSGIFLFSAKAYLDLLKELRPEIFDACGAAIEKGRHDLDFFRLDADAFVQSPSDSIDFAVMEHAPAIAVVPINPGWSDIGSWSSLWDIREKDDDGNVMIGDVLSLNVQNSLIQADGLLVAAVGVSDAVIVATDDAVLVAQKDKAQDVKLIVEALKKKDRLETQSHSKVYRPWGWYQALRHEPGYKVKQISVEPGASLSLQMHNHRAEHWVIVEGHARVTRGDEVIELKNNESTYIPVGTRHRLENVGDSPLYFIEVQTGGRLDEEDIIRYEDRYGRD